LQEHNPKGTLKPAAPVMFLQESGTEYPTFRPHLGWIKLEVWNAPRGLIQRPEKRGGLRKNLSKGRLKKAE
jgi:hypothetical protein